MQCSLFINKDAWDKLPADLKWIVDPAAKETQLWSNAWIENLNVQAINKFKEKVEFVQMDKETNWAFEATTLLYGMHFVLSFAYTHKHDGHVAIDVIESRFSTKFRTVLRIIVNVVMYLPTVGLLATWCIIYATDSWGNLERASTSWAPPLYPFKTIMAIGLVLLFAQGLAKLLGDIRALNDIRNNRNASGESK